MEKPKVTAILYGRSGSGKTMCLNALKGKTLLIDIDSGSDVLWDIKNPKIKIEKYGHRLNELPDLVKSLKEKCEYDNVCIDHITELEKSMLSSRAKVGKNNGAPEQGHYNQVDFTMYDFLREMRNLKDSKNVNVIFTALEGDVKHTLNTGETRNIICPDIRKQDQILGLVDIVAKIHFRKTKDGKTERYLMLSRDGNYTAKDRIFKRMEAPMDELIPADKKENK